MSDVAEGRKPGSQALLAQTWLNKVRVEGVPHLLTGHHDQRPKSEREITECGVSVAIDTCDNDAHVDLYAENSHRRTPRAFAGTVVTPVEHFSETEKANQMPQQR